VSNGKRNNTGTTVAIVGGGALLLWLLLRGEGWGFGGDGGDGQGDGGHGGGAPGSDDAPTGKAAPARCRVRIDGTGMQLDGVPSDLPTITDRCRAAGAADVHATGAAITGVIAEVVHALKAAGVNVWAEPDVWSATNSVPSRRPR
jgi:hypothetical protein